MTKVRATEIYGFDIEESEPDLRFYNLPSEECITVNRELGKMEVILGEADNHKKQKHGEFFSTLESALSSGLEVIVAVDAKFNGAHAKKAEKDLAARLDSYKGVVRSSFDTLYLGIFNELEYVMLLTQCSNSAKFGSFLKKCLGVIADNAKKSLERKKPNYCFHTPELVKNIGEYLEKKIKVTGIPEVIEGFSSYGPRGMRKLDTNYVRAIVQKNGSSFTYNAAMQRQIQKLTHGLNNDMDKSRVIFEWIFSNINYDKDSLLPLITGYRGALQTYQDKKGICGESAALQVTMERLAGNIAFLTEVEKGAVGVTLSGKTVSLSGAHACAAHIRPNGEVVLIDTTHPEGFGIRYNHFNIVSDEHSLARY